MATSSAHGSSCFSVLGVLPSTSAISCSRLCSARAFAGFGDNAISTMPHSTPMWMHESLSFRVSSRRKRRITSKCALVCGPSGSTSLPLKITLSYSALGRSCSQSAIRKIKPGSFLIKYASGFSKNLYDTSSMNTIRVPPAIAGSNEAFGVTAAFTDNSFKAQENDILPSQIEYANTSWNGILNSKLPSHPKLHRGQLENGLEYVILQHNVPQNRVDCAVEVHVGSIDENDDEQGIAHMMEYVCLLGSKKCGKLLAGGISSSSYTDFHHTVFHIHSPTNTKEDNRDVLPSVLDALNEIAFQPKFLASHVGDVKNAILSEIQKMNNIEYLVDCQLLRHLHSENQLSKRFPIGLEEHIQNISVHKIKKFHERWYNFANTTLYIVGDIENIAKTVHKIGRAFGMPRLDNEVNIPKPIAFDEMASFFIPSLPTALQKTSSPVADNSKILRKERDGIRSPLVHNWSFSQSTPVPEPQIFEHELLQEFSVNMFCKTPVSHLQTYRDIREIVMKGIFLSALQFRIDTRRKQPNSPFSSIELQHRDSGREGCAVTTLRVIAEPKNWNSAIKDAVNEVRKLKEFGITKDELARFKHATLKKSEDLANMAYNVTSAQVLRYIMDSIALGHTVMNQRQAHDCVVAIASTITHEEVNLVGAQMVEFISEFGKPNAPVPAGIVACIPTHVPECKPSASEILAAIESGMKEPIAAKSEIEVPTELISTPMIDKLREQLKPAFISLPSDMTLNKLYDEETGITQRYLSNEIAVNYKVSKNESGAGVMRLIVGGGRVAEGPECIGAVLIGVRTLSEGACVGNFTREQVELFCLNHNVSFSLESTEEYICMEFRFMLKNHGMRAAFELLHMVLEHSVWLDDALEKAKKFYIRNFESLEKSVDRSTSYALIKSLLNGDERFVKPAPHVVEKLTLESVKEAVMGQLVKGNMEINVIGDFLEQEIESYILDYLGTVSVKQKHERRQTLRPVGFATAPSSWQFQHLFFEDSIDNACAYIAGPAPNRWGFDSEGTSLYGGNGSTGMLQKLNLTNGGKDIDRELAEKFRKHPLFFAITMGLLAEIINFRLFATVEDSLKLVDGISFEVNLFDCLNLGWYAVSIKSTPSKIYKAVAACFNVLRGLVSNRIEPRELDRAKRILLMRHESDMKSNAYWLKLMAHLQASSVPRKDITTIRDLIWLYEVATIEDIYLAYKQLKVDEDSIYCYISLSGTEALRHKLNNMVQKLESLDKVGNKLRKDRMG